MKFLSGMTKAIRRVCGCETVYLHKFSAKKLHYENRRQGEILFGRIKYRYFTTSSMAATVSSNISVDDTILITIPEVKSFIIKCLTTAGAKLKHAEAMAEVLIAADYRGHFSHGLNRLRMNYLSLIF